jgi:organic radical activating enzyme
MNKQNKSYCRVPFDSVTVSPTGRMQLCCEALWTGGSEKTKIKDIDSIQNWFDGEYLTDVREKMHKGIMLPECEVCYKKEKLHGKSSRTFINEKYFESNTDIDEYSIKKVDLKIGNKCNLKCKMCFPYASSELWKEWKDLGWNTKEKDPNNDTTWRYYDGYFEEDYNWPKNKTNMDKIKEAVSKCKLLHVTGGEPMLNPEFFDLLKHCIDTGTAKDIVLEVTTNATKIHPKFFELAKQFKHLSMTISVDGVGKTYEYVRYPANYDVVYMNIVRYSDFVKSLGGNSRLIFNFVLQVWNLHSTVDVMKTLGPLAVNNGGTNVRIDELEYPKFMHWKMLPEEHIKKAIYQLSEEKNAGHDEIVMWDITSFAKTLKAHRVHREEDYNYQKDQLLKFMHKQDAHRRIKLGDYIPNLTSFLK